MVAEHGGHLPGHAVEQCSQLQLSFGKDIRCHRERLDTRGLILSLLKLSRVESARAMLIADVARVCSLGCRARWRRASSRRRAVRGLVGLDIRASKAQPRADARGRELAPPHQALDRFFGTSKVGRNFANR